MLTARASEILFGIKYFKQFEPKSVNLIIETCKFFINIFAIAEALISVIRLSSQDPKSIFKPFKGSLENTLSKTVQGVIRGSKESFHIIRGRHKDIKNKIIGQFCVFCFFIIISSVRHILLHHSRQKVTNNCKSFGQLIAF